MPAISCAQNSFVDQERSSFKLAGILNGKEDTLQKEFVAKGLQWPANYVYIRSFKYDAQLEVWVKNQLKKNTSFSKHIRSACRAAQWGQKDCRVITRFPKAFIISMNLIRIAIIISALGLNYPNASDRILSDSLRPGNAIYIHGSCVSVGCIPVTDDEIEEIYIIASYARANGEDFIPVHVFPIRYNSKRSMEYFKTAVKNNPSLQKFEHAAKKCL